MELIEAGELGARIRNNSHNEFGKLSEGFNSLMDKMQILMQDIKEKEAIRRETKLKLLQNQINPHFLYNTIETIISCVRLNLLDQSIGVSQALARFFRISLSQGTDIISLDEEFKLTNYYLSILKIRHVEYLDYRICLDDNLGFVKIPKLTLQPLVENAVKHGLKFVKEQGFISVTGARQGQFVIIEVFDNGCGIPQQKIQELYEEINSEENSLGIGIKNVASRLILLYGNQFEMEIESIVDSYSKFIIKIKLEEDKDA
jgi:two-component system sensor histidine kinase YesM